MLDSTIVVGHGIVMYVRGSPSATVDGSGSVRLFKVATGGTLHLSDLVLTRGYAVDNGGAVYVESRAVASIMSCTFTNNTAFYYGGGVANNGNVTNMSDCMFTSN
ncbi:unnamed protein product, partial [Phaeothamnion confervicola]